MKKIIIVISIIVICGFSYKNSFSQNTLNLEQISVEIIIDEFKSDSTINLENYYINEYSYNEGPSNLAISSFFLSDSVSLKILDNNIIYNETDEKNPKKLIIPERFKKKLFEKRERIDVSNFRLFNNKYFIRISFITSSFSGREYILMFDENGQFKKLIRSDWIE